MSKQHEVNVMVSRDDGSRQSVLTTRKCQLREWLIKKLFGDVREILILNPGETVRSVAIQEVKGE